MDEFAIRPDEERGARDAGDGLAVHRLVAEKIVALDEHLVGIGQQRILDVVFLREPLLRTHSIARDAENDGAGFLKLCKLVAKAAGFDRAAGRVGAWIEEEDDGRTFELRERNGVAVLVGEGEVFDDIAGFGLHKFWCRIKLFVTRILPYSVTLPSRALDEKQITVYSGTCWFARLGSAPCLLLSLPSGCSPRACDRGRFPANPFYDRFARLCDGGCVLRAVGFF